MDKDREQLRGKARSCVARSRPLAVVVVLSLAAALAFAPAAYANGDPLAGGSFSLKLSAGLKHQLKKSRVSLKPDAFAVKDGTIDPIAGTGSLTLGNLRFKHGSKHVTYKEVTATLGPGGALTANGVTLFSLTGGKVARNSFGATITGVRATLLKRAAQKLNRKLDVRSLHKGEVGTAEVVSEPKTVEVTGGAAAVTGFSILYPGSVAQKAGPHCINALSGITPIAPATSNGAIPPTPPTFTLPVTGGTISPDGSDGVVNLAGGYRIANKKNQQSGCSSATGSLQVDQTDFTIDFQHSAAKAHVVISGRTSPPTGDQGVVFSSILDSSDVTVSADPAGHTVTITGGVIKLNGGAALYLNQVFQQPTYLWANELMAGDPLATVRLTVNTR